MDTNGHEFVEIGGIKWATMNIGANSITDTGLYFQWGDTQGYTAAQVGSGSGQKYFGLEDYKFWASDDGSGSSGYTKYNSSDGKTLLDIEDDGVHAYWGGDWRMPVSNEFYALTAATTSAWTTDYQGSGINGFLLTDKTDSSKTLFFPVCGQLLRGKLSNDGSYGYYASKVRSGNDNGSCMTFVGYKNNVLVGGNYRYSGKSIRGVLGKN